MTDKSKWIWMPHAGHFIGGNKCRFHLNTYVGGFIVSTVGELWCDSVVRRILAERRAPKLLELNGDAFDAAYEEEIGFEEIGIHRTYETMVFEAKPMKVEDKAWACCPYQIDLKKGQLDMRGYNTPADAMRGHMEMCEKWAKEKVPNYKGEPWEEP